MAQKVKERIKNRYSSIKPFLPLVMFCSGFLWDSLTLKRIDNTLDLSIFGVYLLAAALITILIGRDVKFKYSGYFPLALQFLFGGLFSGFVVYYFQSASSFTSFLFIILLFTVLVANEFLDKKLQRYTVPFTMFSFSTLVFLNFLVPIIVKKMGIGVFLVSVLLSVALSGLVYFIIGKGRVNYKFSAMIYLLIMGSYFLNIIPPVPLATKAMGIYRNVERDGPVYRCTYEKPSFFSFNKKSGSNYRYSKGDIVYCFTSVFAPVELKKKIYHHWLFYNQEEGKYILSDKLGYRITGGRDDGYRGYTLKKNISLGKWRVDLKTDDNKVLGSVSFSILENLGKKVKLKTIDIN